MLLILALWVEAGGSIVQGHPWQHGERKAGTDYFTPCLKKTKMRTGEMA